MDFVVVVVRSRFGSSHFHPSLLFFSRRQATIHAITHIMKLVLLSKLDEQAAYGLRHDALVNEMIVDHVSSSRTDFVLRVAICVDGRRNPETGLDFYGRGIEAPANMAEARNLKNLICDRVGEIPMEFVDFSFVRPAADAQEVAQSCHIMLFVGYGRDPKHIQRILAKLQPGCILPDIVRKMCSMDDCGGSVCVVVQCVRATDTGTGVRWTCWRA